MAEKDMLSAEDAVITEISSILSRRRRDLPKIEASSLLRDELGLTSLDVVELFVGACKVTGTEMKGLTYEDFDRIKNVGDIVNLLSRTGHKT